MVVRLGSTPRRRRAAAWMTTLFVMATTVMLVVAALDTETLQFATLRNTLDYDRARYLAEAGIQHALAELEQDINWRTGVTDVEFPVGSGNTYTATAADGPEGTVIVTATGRAGSFQRRLEVQVKQGG